jgi:rhodanese-related sulfurtransferase
MADLHDIVEGVRDTLSKLTPVPVILGKEATAYDLKTRLEWGEPALSIVDVRDRDRFNRGRIMGAMSMPLSELGHYIEQSALEPKHDIYIYGESDEQALAAAEMLRSAGFETVAQITGGLRAWQEVAGPTEGIDEDGKSPDASAYNLISRLQTESAVQAAGKAQHTHDS